MKNKQRKQTGAVSEPHVGIFWLVGEKLLFDTTPLSRAEEYGECRIHSGNHVSVWERFRFARTVPQEMEYEEPPRGRVVFNAKKSEFSLLADRCILRWKDLVTTIRRQMHLPKNTTVDTDSHYRCFSCLLRSTAE